MTCAGNIAGWSGKITFGATFSTGARTILGRVRGVVLIDEPPHPNVANEAATTVMNNPTRAGKLRMAGPCQSRSIRATSWTTCHEVGVGDGLS